MGIIKKTDLIPFVGLSDYFKRNDYFSLSADELKEFYIGTALLSYNFIISLPIGYLAFEKSYPLIKTVVINAIKNLEKLLIN